MGSGHASAPFAGRERAAGMGTIGLVKEGSRPVGTRWVVGKSQVRMASMFERWWGRLRMGLEVS